MILRQKHGSVVPTEKLYKCQSCGHVYTEEEYEYLDENPQEVYEWWTVTNWLGDKLKERGEVVIEGWGHWYWGRGNTGQGIALDGCDFKNLLWNGDIGGSEV